MFHILLYSSHKLQSAKILLMHPKFEMSYCSFFQNCDGNMWLFFIAPYDVIALSQFYVYFLDCSLLYSYRSFNYALFSSKGFHYYLLSPFRERATTIAVVIVIKGSNTKKRQWTNVKNNKNKAKREERQLFTFGRAITKSVAH